MRDAGVAAGLEDVEEPRQVGIAIGMRIFSRIAHARLRREVDDVAKLVLGKQPVDGWPVLQRAAHEGETRVLSQFLEPRQLQRGVVIIIEIIKPDDGRALAKQALRHVKADKAGRARHQDGMFADAGRHGV